MDKFLGLHGVAGDGNDTTGFSVLALLSSLGDSEPFSKKRFRVLASSCRFATPVKYAHQLFGWRRTVTAAFFIEQNGKPEGQ